MSRSGESKRGPSNSAYELPTLFLSGSLVQMRAVSLGHTYTAHMMHVRRLSRGFPLMLVSTLNEVMMITSAPPPTPLPPPKKKKNPKKIQQKEQQQKPQPTSRKERRWQPAKQKQILRQKQTNTDWNRPHPPIPIYWFSITKHVKWTMTLACTSVTDWVDRPFSLV